MTVAVEKYKHVGVSFCELAHRRRNVFRGPTNDLSLTYLE